MVDTRDRFDFDAGGNGLPVFHKESEFQDWLEEKFESAGWTAIQEVSPHRSNYRVDLLLIHDEFGRIGMELKRLTGGTDAGTAHQQIVRQYSGRKYIGERVDKWAFAPYMPKLQFEQEKRDSSFQYGKMEVLEHFFQSYGIGVLNVHESAYARLKWGPTKEYMLPAFSMKRQVPERNVNGYDLDKIEKRVDERLYQK